jgi:hypothetical protein
MKAQEVARNNAGVDEVTLRQGHLQSCRQYNNAINAAQVMRHQRRRAWLLTGGAKHFEKQIGQDFFRRKAQNEPGFELTKPSTDQELQLTSHARIAEDNNFTTQAHQNNRRLHKKPSSTKLA